MKPLWALSRRRNVPVMGACLQLHVDLVIANSGGHGAFG